MVEYFLDQKETASRDSEHPSTSGVIKKDWQKPKLVEMNYSETNEGGGSGDDGVAFS